MRVCKVNSNLSRRFFFFDTGVSYLAECFFLINRAPAFRSLLTFPGRIDDQTAYLLTQRKKRAAPSGQIIQRQQSNQKQGSKQLKPPRCQWGRYYSNPLQSLSIKSMSLFLTLKPPPRPTEPTVSPSQESEGLCSAGALPQIQRLSYFSEKEKQLCYS